MVRTRLTVRLQALAAGNYEAHSHVGGAPACSGGCPEGADRGARVAPVWRPRGVRVAASARARRSPRATTLAMGGRQATFRGGGDARSPLLRSLARRTCRAAKGRRLARVTLLSRRRLAR
eukprot:871543-Prorocentrum_minimum.AAC.1